ncbi:MAG: NAD(P)-dependent dehydrogenase (short-subunit alcohol dehydrogenase family) [Porticoccus sp.]|jgi:NAD(P)-dependent dehydrogenase (short-subunit alcohol dehydrogenase family)
MGIYALTGGATGIGAAIKQQLIDDGHELVVVDIKDADIIADLATTAGRDKAIVAITAAAPNGLDGFVPCAGIAPVITPSSLIISVNFFGAINLVKGLKPLLVKRSGSVVLVSSNSAPMGSDEQTVDAMLEGDESAACKRADEVAIGQSAYGASKLALARWMRRNTAEYAQAGIRINAVAPGVIQTPMTDQVAADPEYGQLIKDFAASIPVGRSGTPQDIANAVCFMLSDKAAFMAGSVMFVDGGHDAMLRSDQF